VYELIEKSKMLTSLRVVLIGGLAFMVISFSIRQAPASQVPKQAPKLTQLKVKVVDAEGKPVAGAVVEFQYIGKAHHDVEDAVTGVDGTSNVERAQNRMVLFSRTNDGKAAGVARVDQKQMQATIRLGPLASAEGRLLDHEGKVVKGGKIKYGVRVYDGPEPNSGFYVCFGGETVIDPEERFSLKGLVTGERYHVDLETGKHRWRTVTTVTPSKAENIQIGDLRLPNPDREREYTPPTLEQRTTSFFEKRGKMIDRIAKAQEEGKRHYLRVLLIVGDPREQRTREFVELLGKDRTTIEYEEVAVSVEDTKAISVLCDHYGLDTSPANLPALLVLGEDGKTVATQTAPIGAADLKGFLTKHALPRRDAVKVLTTAQDLARREGKLVFLQQSGPSCGPCARLSRFFDEHKAILTPHYIFVEIDSVRFANASEVMARYRKKKDDVGYPWCAVLDAEGKMLANWDGPEGSIGFPNELREINYLIKLLKTTAPKITSAQLAELRRALEKK
jgi:hypothetical protein